MPSFGVLELLSLKAFSMALFTRKVQLVLGFAEAAGAVSLEGVQV